MSETQWVVIEMKPDTAGVLQPVAEPHTLQVSGEQTQVVWYIFTDGFELDSQNGVDLRNTTYVGLAGPDSTRPGCWTAVIAPSTGPLQQKYTINVRNTATNEVYAHDPVIENDPPPTTGEFTGVNKSRGASVPVVHQQ
jgi:hypothetical protein